MFFSLKPSASQWESSLKILAHLASEELGNTQTHSLTDWRFRVSVVVPFPFVANFVCKMDGEGEKGLNDYKMDVNFHGVP